MSLCREHFSRRWSIFCRVVDNYGDIGVCWRVARMLALHHQKQVRMWVDEPQALMKILGREDSEVLHRNIEGVEVLPWLPPFGSVIEDDVIIEAFSCDLPEDVLSTMAARTTPSRWINLEYLSAEDWVEECHGLPSPHPRLPLMRHFFFPGFTPATGGVLREPGLLTRRDHFRNSARVWLNRHTGCDISADALVISLFSYEQPNLTQLMRLWAAQSTPVWLLVPAGRVVADVANHFGVDAMAVDEHRRSGALNVLILPFTDQDTYDRLLWACDLNFVRGEDSFVRAQWAGKPFVWQIYPQEEAAHLRKLEDFLLRYVDTWATPCSHAVTEFWRAWNGVGDLAAAWPAMAASLPVLAQYAEQWSDTLAEQEDLVSQLVRFSETSV